jgi:DNA-binding transcriptional LysR family regulator
VSKPSLTNGIKRLESEIGGNLFHRGGRKTKLTPLGAAVQPHLEKIMRCFEKVVRHAGVKHNQI